MTEEFRRRPSPSEGPLAYTSGDAGFLFRRERLIDFRMLPEDGAQASRLMPPVALHPLHEVAPAGRVVVWCAALPAPRRRLGPSIPRVCLSSHPCFSTPPNRPVHPEKGASVWNSLLRRGRWARRTAILPAVAAVPSVALTSRDVERRSVHVTNLPVLAEQPAAHRLHRCPFPG